MNIRFSTPHQYVFIHENVKHLLLIWSKERKKQLYIVEDEGEAMILTEPGDTYAETVLAQVEPFFFCQLEAEEEIFSVVLGATFVFHNKLVGMYYRREQPDGNPYFFYLEDGDLNDIPDQEYEDVVRTFLKEYPEYIKQS
ncbi:hypothetical protein [Melghirimyces algeriensis]|uniref:Uncharacterized protein n=1 Tax=Melghirimyces algeriensis TaxID=910412 RepID=A0A521C1H5_9BACL|nr:hypothetical protein [Melghirimyces algeriensis]SMO53299.1 hypothetical protein SAMN06264849_10374 [Melghirimyces algeriensis]